MITAGWGMPKTNLPVQGELNYENQNYKLIKTSIE